MLPREPDHSPDFGGFKACLEKQSTEYCFRDTFAFSSPMSASGNHSALKRRALANRLRSAYYRKRHGRAYFGRRSRFG